MRSAVVLLQLSLWVSVSHAFYPWFPKYRCDRDGTCQAAKREQVDGDAGLTDDAVQAARESRVRALPIRQRVASRHEFDPEQVAREASRLAAKYAGREPSSSDFEVSDIAKRQNVYRVIEPAETSHENSAGVWQDGSDFSYFLRAKLGSEGKELFMLIDTGAATSWVMGSDCTSTACEKHDSFGADDSESFEGSEDEFSVTYGSGSVKGTKATDKIAFADMTLDKFQIGIANTTSNDFNHFPFDGILGLSLARGHTDNFIRTAQEDGAMDKGLFCVFLSRSSDGPNTGEISFGSCNPDKYTGDFSYTDVGTSNGDWAITLDSISYGGEASSDSGRLAYIDTGTSYVFGPKDDVKAFHETIPGSSSSDGTTWKVPCESDETVAYTFSGVSYNISAKDWRSKPGNDGKCTSNIYGHEVVRGAWLLGDLFLKNVYAAFDADEKRIGFATRTPVPSEEEDPEDGDPEDGDDTQSESESEPSATSASSAPQTSTHAHVSTQSGEPTSQPTSAPSGIVQPEPSLPSSQPDEIGGGSETAPSRTGEAAAAETGDDSAASNAQIQTVLAAVVGVVVTALVW